MKNVPLVVVLWAASASAGLDPTWPAPQQCYAVSEPMLIDGDLPVSAEKTCKARVCYARLRCAPDQPAKRDVHLTCLAKEDGTCPDFDSCVADTNVRLEEHTHNDPRYSDLDLDPDEPMCRLLRLDLIKVTHAECGEVSLCFPVLTCNLPPTGADAGTPVIRRRSDAACKRDWRNMRDGRLGCPETAQQCMDDPAVRVQKTTIKNLKLTPTGSIWTKKKK